MRHLYLQSSPFWRWSFWMMVLLTVWLSLIPGEQVPQGLHFWDKAQHAFGFAVLGFLGLMAYPVRVRPLLTGLVLLGAGIEVAQWMTGWRHGDWQDWVADCVGMLIGYTGWKAVKTTAR